MTIFYCLRFETLPNWRARSPNLLLPGTGSPSYTPRHWVPLSSPLTTHRTTEEVFEPASTRATAIAAPVVFKAAARQERRRKHSPSIVEVCLPRACMLRTLPINGRCLPSHCLATGLYATILISCHVLLYSLTRITLAQAVMRLTYIRQVCD
jgi:hypothetical protein